MQKQKQLLITIIFTLILSLIAAVTIMAAPESLHLSIVTDATQVKTGDVLTLTYQLVNSEIVTRDVIFYAEIPTGTQFRTVENADPITYTTGLLREDGSMLPPDVEAITWHGAFTGPLIITLTVDILDQSGSILAKAALVDNVTHVTEMVVSKDIFRVYQVTYMPMVFKNYTNGGTLVTPTPDPTPEPTPLPTVTPPASGDVLTATKRMGFTSRGSDNYDTVLQGAGVIYSGCNTPIDLLHRLGQDFLPGLFGGGDFAIDRLGLAFNTLAYTNINTATLTFTVTDAKSNTPEDFRVVIESAPILANVICGEEEVITNTTQTVWNSVTPGISAIVDVQSATYPVTMTINLPPALLTPGNYSYLRFRLHREGTAPYAETYGGTEYYQDIASLGNVFLTINGN